jgi:hypothetical protein
VRVRERERGRAERGREGERERGQSQRPRQRHTAAGRGDARAGAEMGDTSGDLSFFLVLGSFFVFGLVFFTGFTSGVASSESLSALCICG